MKNLKFISIFALLFFLLFNACITREKGTANISPTVNKPNKLIDSLIFIEPIEIKTEFIYKYKDFNLEFNSSNMKNKLIFHIGGKSIEKKLSFFYEYPEVLMQLHKSPITSDFVFIVEGQDYYSSSFGVYYLCHKLDTIVEIDDTLHFDQNDPEKFGLKKLKADVLKKGDHLFCKFYLGDKLMFEKKYSLNEILSAGFKKNKVEEK